MPGDSQCDGAAARFEPAGPAAKPRRSRSTRAQTGNGLLAGQRADDALKRWARRRENLADLNNNHQRHLGEGRRRAERRNLTLVGERRINVAAERCRHCSVPTLTAPTAGSTTPVLDLMIASSDGTNAAGECQSARPDITTSNIDAHLAAMTGDGQVLGNLLYNLANLADPGGPAALLNLFNLLGAGNRTVARHGDGRRGHAARRPPQQLLTINLKPMDLNLLGLEVQTDPIVVTISAQAGDGKLLGQSAERHHDADQRRRASSTR